MHSSDHILFYKRVSAHLEKFRRDVVFVHSYLPATARSKVLDPFSHFYGGLSLNLVNMRYHSALVLHINFMEFFV